MSTPHSESQKVDFLGCGVDRHGRVFELDGLIYRALTPAGKRIVDHIIASGSSQHLIDSGLIPFELADISLDDYCAVLRHKKLNLISFCQEWPFVMLKNAALLLCRLTKELLAIGLATKDAHPWNIAFDFTRPIFLDFGSIVFLDDFSIDAWIAEFKKDFYVPMWLAAHKHCKMARWSLKEHPIGPIKRTLCQKPIFNKALFTFNRLAAKATVQGFGYFLDRLIEHLECLPVSPPKGEWSDYDQAAWKAKLVENIVDQLEAKTLIDLAANKGTYSMVAADHGLSVVAIDLDEFSVEHIYREAHRLNKRILPLVMDVLWPTPPFDIGLFHESSYKRLRCDIGIALAIVHHLVFKGGADFRTIAAIISRYVHRYALVEFIPPDDMYISKWIRGREAKYEWYTEHRFVNTFMQYFQSFDVWHSPFDTRKLYLFERE